MICLNSIVVWTRAINETEVIKEILTIEKRFMVFIVRISPQRQLFKSYWNKKEIWIKKFSAIQCEEPFHIVNISELPRTVSKNWKVLTRQNYADLSQMGKIEWSVLYRRARWSKFFEIFQRHSDYFEDSMAFGGHFSHFGYFL